MKHFILKGFYYVLFLFVFLYYTYNQYLIISATFLAYTLPIQMVITRLYNLIKKKEKNGFVFNWIRDLPVERLGLLLAVLQMYQLVRENLKEVSVMYTALFIVSLVMFAYLMYVLIKPEKF